MPDHENGERKELLYFCDLRGFIRVFISIQDIKISTNLNTENA
jgi:hypothetical protein